MGNKKRKHLSCLANVIEFQINSWGRASVYRIVPVNKWKINDSSGILLFYNSHQINGSRSWQSQLLILKKEGQPNYICLLIKEHNTTCSVAKKT